VPKRRLSHYLRLIPAGESVEITERGTPICCIIPTALRIDDHIEALDKAGLLLWNKRKLKPLALIAQIRSKRTVADLLAENRK
jgi:antitoxin (DNA-binding transcriptional repressor) of toxin-antitoxin stability system